VTDQPAEAQGARFSLWRLSGRKSLLHDGERLLLTVEDHPRPLRLALSGGVEEGTLLDIVLPASSAIRNLWPAFARLMTLLESSEQPHPERSLARPSREMLVHMRTLQALDAETAGATHRQIASVVFGKDEVFQRWETNSELRAQVRYLLRRGHALQEEGYCKLLSGSATKKEGEFNMLAFSP
jgi:hypothetical protein